MQSIEFKAIIKNGIIQLPAKYFAWAGKWVRIVISAEKEEDAKTDFNKLKEIQNQLTPLKAFSTIENPVSWQQQLRDEW